MTASASVAPGTPRSTAAKPVRQDAAPPAAVPWTDIHEGIATIQVELAAIRGILEAMVPAASPAGLDESLEGSVTALRRLLSETIEGHMESFMGELVSIRAAACSDSPDNLKAVVNRIDRLLENLGAVPIEANRLDHLDPLIHTPVKEDHLADAPDGVVLETKAPGYRTGRGAVVAKAAVVVNRRS